MSPLLKLGTHPNFFASRFQAEQVVEFGCGSGIVSLLMARKSPAFKGFELFEIQPELWGYAARNVENNPMPEQTFTVRCEDVRFAMPTASAELVVCNPPLDRKTGG